MALTSLAFAQKEWTNWYLDGNTKLTFKNGRAEKVTDFITNPPPVPPWENIYHFAYWGRDGGISYSDPLTGEVQFIISNRLGFGKDYNDFPNDTVLSACPGDEKAYQIIPIPDNPGKFYVIQFQSIAHDLAAAETGLQVRCPNAIGLGYSIVDMKKNNGMGDFVAMNKVITRGLTEQITYIKHANGKDVWIVCHPYGTSQYHAILVSASGFAQPVISNIGVMVNGGSSSVYGVIKASPDGKLIAGAHSASTIPGRGFSNLELFDFDNSTGILTNYRTLPADGPISHLQFSPDNSKLYLTGYNEDYSFNKLIQYDFNETNLTSSKTELINTKSGDMTYMQLGPDGKIYISRYAIVENDEYKDFLIEIQCPNLPKYASNVKLRGIDLGYFPFPNLINDFINVSRVKPPPRFSLGNDTSICFGKHVLTAPEGWESYQWNTGETTRQITIKEPGTYFVLTGNTGFSCPSGYGFIKIGNSAAPLNLGKDTTICPKAEFRLKIPDGYTDIRWQNGSTTRDSVLNKSGLIIISANDPKGCRTIDTLSLISSYYPIASFGPDTILCNNEKLTLRLEPTNVFGGNARYLWSDGSTNETLLVGKPGTYWGRVDFNGCTDSDTIQVNYISKDALNLGKDTLICNGDSLLLSTNISGATYKWSTGETTRSIYAKKEGSYWLSVSSGVCTLRDTIFIGMVSRPNLSLGNDTSLCQGQKLTLNPGLVGGQFRWEDGSNAPTRIVDKGGRYLLTYTQNDCSVRDSIEVIFKPLPTLDLGKDTGFCANTTFLIKAEHLTIKSYLWSDQSTSPTLLVNKAGVYHVQVVGQNGCKNFDTIQLSTKDLPVFSLGADTSICEGVVLSLQVNVENANFLWSNGNRTNSLSIQEPGLYWLETNRVGCTFRDSIRVKFKPLPRVELGNDTTLCEGNNLLLSANYPGASRIWQDGNGDPSYRVTKPGLYSITLNLNDCIFKDSIRIAYTLKPRITLVSDTFLCVGQSLILTPTTNTAVAFRWQNGDRTPTFNVRDTGKYVLNVSNECGEANHSVHVIQGLCKLYLPTAFTPNGDNLNELFRIKYPFPVKNFNMKVFSRYGEVVFESTNMDNGWDGTIKGRNLPSGNYIWTITVVYNDNTTDKLHGSVLLLR